MKAQARIPTEFHYWGQGTIPQNLTNGFQAVAQWDHNESLILQTHALRGCKRNWVKSWLWWSGWKHSHWLQAGLGSHPLLNVRAATKYQNSFQPPKSVWSHSSRFSGHSRAPTHSPAGSWDGGEPGGGRQDGGVSIKVSPRMEQMEKSDNLEQLLCYSALGALLKAFGNKNTSSQQRLRDLLSCVKSLLTAQWHLKKTDRDVHHKYTLKGITNGN